MRLIQTEEQRIFFFRESSSSIHFDIVDIILRHCEKNEFLLNYLKNLEPKLI